MQILIGLVVAIFATYMVVRHVRVKRAAMLEMSHNFYAAVLPLLTDAVQSMGESQGSLKLIGRYHGEMFQFTSVVDTLSVRKLPSLWLLITLAKPQRLKASVDLMMRPAGPTTFSNFDFLPHGVPTPVDFPEHAVIRSDVAGVAAPFASMKQALQLFYLGKGKELLLSPKGLRMVVQLSQADRARYGVLREARFENTAVDPALAIQIMNALLDLDATLTKELMQ